MPEASIGPGCRVTLYFSLKLEDGTVVDSNFDKQPASFTLGDGSLLPGFEQRLLGLAALNEIDVILPAEDAFGMPNPGNIQFMERARFFRFLDEEFAELVPGTVVAFKDAAGFDLPGVIRSVSESGASVDFNHPLAGRDIGFRARIVSVIAADTRAVEVKL